MSTVRRRATAPVRPRGGDPFGRPGQYRLLEDVAWRVKLGHPHVYRDALGGRAVTSRPGPWSSCSAATGNSSAAASSIRTTRSWCACCRAIPTNALHPGAGAIAARFGRALQTALAGASGANRPTAMRLFSGESEGLPGVQRRSLRRFRRGAVAQRRRVALARRAVRRHRRARSGPRGIYEQRRLRPLGGQAPPEPAVRARGEEAPLEVVVEEGGLPLRRRRHRAAGRGLLSRTCAAAGTSVAARAADRRVLNLFSYTGAFSVRAAKAGAREVVSVDSVAKVHARARRNCELSGIDPRAHRGRHRGRGQDAGQVRVAWAAASTSSSAIRRRFPTPRAPARRSRSRAISASWPPPALRVLEPGGLLAFSTNSTKLAPAEVERALAEGARAQMRVPLLVSSASACRPTTPSPPASPRATTSSSSSRCAACSRAREGRGRTSTLGVAVHEAAGAS